MRADKTRKHRITLVLVMIGSLAAIAIPGLLGARWNKSASYPIGLYWKVNKTPEKGDLVRVRIPDLPIVRTAQRRGYFGYDGQIFLLKRLVAIGGDEVSIGPSGVFVNRHFINNSRPLICDAQGRPLVEHYMDHQVLKSNEILLMSEHSAESFDSRYFGPVTREPIVEVVVPILTF